MKRTLTIAALLATMTVAGMMPSASAVGVAGVLFIPPFEGAEPTVISAITHPCEVILPVVDTPTTDPAAGSFSLNAQVEVRSCVNHAVERIDEWTLGDVPAPLVGTPATIIADFEITNAAAAASGSGTLEAAVTVALAGGRAQDLASYRCAGGGCDSLHKEGLVQLVEQVTALPEQLTFTFHSSALAQNATGHASAAAEGTLRRVVVMPHVV